MRWPLARVAMGGRASAGVLYALAQDTRGCRERAMGEASGLRLISGLTDQLVSGLASTSRAARSERVSGFAAVLRMIGDLRVQLRRKLPTCVAEPVAR